MRAFLFALLLLPVVAAAQTDTVWSLNQIDQDGIGTHPNLSELTNPVWIRGVALNASEEYLPTAPVWQVYVQGIDGDQGGVAVFEGFFPGNQAASLHPLGVEAGDIVDVTGFLGFHNGKTNINSRHGTVALFEVEIVQKGAGMPEPIEIPGIDACNFFDADDDDPGTDRYRRAGGEHFQGQWCRLSHVWIVSGDWENDGSVVITDNSGETLNMKLSAMGDFNDNPMPNEPFNVTGIFNQEDGSAPYHDGYVIWVKSTADITGIHTNTSGWQLYR